MPSSSATQTPDDTQQQHVAESVLLARSSPGGLALATDPRFHYPDHIAWIDEEIVEAIAAQQSEEAAVREASTPNIIIEMPPRHGKSWLASQWLPAWFTGTYPEKRVLFGAYEHDFAAQWGRRARTILEGVGPSLFGVGVADDSRARNRWEAKLTWLPDQDISEEGIYLWGTEDGGGMMTAGVGGPFTGKGGELIIVDDPVKNRAEAESETFRDRTWEWFTDAVWTRREPGCVVVVIMARWHEDDLAGRLQKDMAEGGVPWQVLRAPALAEKDDPLGREEGVALWPERYDEEALRQTAGVLGSYSFSGLYQARPTAPIGGIWQRPWWQTYERWPVRFDQVVCSWDMAFKKKSDTDFVVGQLWGRRRAEYFLLAQVRARLNFTETKAAVRALYRWGAGRKARPNAVLVEDKANGPAIVSELRSTIEGMLEVEPEGGKEARAHAVSGTIESGNVLLPDGSIPAPLDRRRRWEPTPVKTFIDEAAAFPRGANDDQVDATSQALNWMRNRVSVGESESQADEGQREAAAGSETADLMDRDW